VTAGNEFSEEGKHLKNKMMNSIKDFILLIPCYNNPDGLSRSIKSIHYPIEKFELLIVDDGSTVPVSIDKLEDINPAITIQIIRLDQNQGIANALNTGLKTLKDRTDYNYIARLDAGDTCHAERFTKQVQFLDSHRDIFLLGSWCRFENTKTGKGYDYITKTKHEEIVKEMHYKCSFIHPTVMFRKEVLSDIGFYPENYSHAEDYAFFWSILKKQKATTLPEILIFVELGNTVSSKNYKKQLKSREKIIKEFGEITVLKFWGILLLQLKLLLPTSIIRKIKQFH
jgi:glycosyltransferase involved in cell wall biosynthesis